MPTDTYQERDEDGHADQQLCHGSSRMAGVSFGSGQATGGSRACPYRSAYDAAS
jgi:hypothetical protein